MQRDDPSGSRHFEGWLTANAILGSVLTTGILGMALAGLYSAGPPPDKATEFSSVARK